MDLGGIFGKIEANADKLGGLVGGFGALSWWSKLYGRDLGATISLLMDRLMTDPHIPDLGHLWAHTMDPRASPGFRTGLMAWIVGYALDQIDLDTRISSAGKALQKAGLAAAFATLGVNALFFASVEHSDGADHGLGGGSHFGFLSGSHHSPVGAYTELTHAPAGTNLTRSAASSLGVYP